MYLVIFIIADIISLVLQAVGGGGAAVQAQNFEDTTSNTHISKLPPPVAQLKPVLAGILFQLGTTTIFLVLAADFMYRVIARKPYSASTRARFNFTLRKSKKAATGAETPASSSADAGSAEKGAADEVPHEWIRRSEYLLAGVAWASVMIYIRGIYRSVELAQGWTGHVMTHEPYFIWLDGFMMVLCMAGLAVAHPGFLLPASGWS